MVKRKAREKKVTGLNLSNICPYCGCQVKKTDYILPSAGFFVNHLWNDKLCAFVPFPTACDLNDFLERSDVLDVLRDEKA